MSSRTQRILCRAGFVSFCVLPTLALGAWIVNERVIQGAASPALEAQAKPLAEAELSRRLGLTVTLERLEYPQAGYTLLEGVQIADPETRRRIASIASLELARHGEELIVVATRPEIDADHWSDLWESLHDRVLRERGEKVVPMRLTARQMTLVSRHPGRSPTLTDVDVQLAAGKFSLDFRVAGLDMRNPVRFRASRDRAASPPFTRWEIHTGEAALPCALLVDYAPWLWRLGDRCHFNGSLWAEDAGDGWRGELTGRFLAIDLDRLVSEQFPHKLSGEAEAVVSRVEFTGGRVRTAAGFLEAGPGTISRGLLEQSVVHLGLWHSENFGEAVAELSRYSQLKLGFSLNEAGLQLSGKCDTEGTVLVLESDFPARLHDRYPETISVASLVRALAPASELQVSASREGDALLRILPLPPVKRPEPAGQAVPEGRVRLPTGEAN